MASGEEGRALQNVLICVEMIVAAPFMWIAFPSSDYAEAGGLRSCTPNYWKLRLSAKFSYERPKI